MALKTDYKDYALDATKNSVRKFKMIENDDGTVSFEDMSEYSQIGDSLGADDINNITKSINQQSEQKVDKTGITLGTHTDGLVYIFINGKPVGNGLSISGGGTVEPDTPTATDDITLTDGVMTILALANEPTLTGGVLAIA